MAASSFADTVTWYRNVARKREQPDPAFDLFQLLQALESAEIEVAARKMHGLYLGDVN